MTENENNINKNDNSNNTISLSLEEENILKDAKIFLQEDYNIKTEQLKLLKQELSQIKKQFQNQIQEYQNDIKLTIDKEKEIQLLYSKISKKKKRRSLILKNSFNNKFYIHLLEISSNNKKEKILKNYFSLLMLENPLEIKNIKELIEILKNEEEIKNLLYYSYKIYYDLNQKDINLYNNLKEKFEKYICDLKDLEEGGYPFDEMYECLGIIFEIIEYEKNIKENNFILNKLIEKKNGKFVEIKNIENRIKSYYKNIKKIKSHIKIIHSLFDNFKEQNANNNSNSLKELIENIKEYKKIDFDYHKMNPNFDAISSLTFGTYCTQSEDSSMKSSTLGSKSKLINNKLIKSNNNNINNKVSKFNNNELKSEKTDKEENLKNNKNIKLNKNLKEKQNNKINMNNISINANGNKNNKIKNNIFINENNKENKNQINSKNHKYNNINFIEIKNSKINNKQNKLFSNQNKDLNSNINKPNINDNKEILKNNINKSQNQSEEQKSQNDKIEPNINKENKIEEEKEIIDNKKIITNFANLHLLGSKIDQLKHREPDESVEMTMPKENTNKNYNIINSEYNFNDSSVCDEMISFNYENGNNMGRSTTNDYINKIGVKNNVVLSQELYKNKLFMRRNMNDFGKLKIEKSIEASTCCVSCTYNISNIMKLVYYFITLLIYYILIII